ncbi:hypothetical protein QYE76_003872 [Lolium multiflorum]|uniref:Uncharacterized protein n=1 Tax=Lolium multiflorum TaxID=4521 RepID=A0AAD8RRI5_LOLMU|nr:hypothetical protein QYE76_003872 [Lolium multiflorum]
MPNAPNAELVEVKGELKKMNKQLRQLIELKKQANLMAGLQYDAPENPYDTTIVDYEPEVESSDVDSDDESFHTKTRHVLRRLQSGQYDGPFARGIYKCPFCNRRLRDTDFNTLLNHVESIGRYGARVGRTVNVHAYMAKHKALGIHLRNLQASHTRYLEALNVPTALSLCDCSICRAA